MKESVQSFSNEVLPFREQLHDTIICQYNIAQNVADLYTAKAHAREVERFKAAHKKIISTYWNEFVSFDIYVYDCIIKNILSQLYACQIL